TGSVVVNKSTTGTANLIVALDGTSVGTMSGLKLPSGAFNATLTAATTASASYVLRLPAAAPAAGQAMQSDASGNFTWFTPSSGVINNTAALTNGKMWLGNASGIAAEVAMSGDATISNVGLLSLKNTGTAGTYGSAVLVPVVTTDAQGRVTAVTTAAPLDVTKLPLAGGTMTGAIAMGAQNITNTGTISMAANKYFGLSANSTNSSTAGQMWYDTGVIKYYDGAAVKSLGVAGAGITTLNGLSTVTQSFVAGTAGNDFAISSAGSAHTFDLPSASATKRGALTSADWSTFNAKQDNALASTQVWVGNSSG